MRDVGRRRVGRRLSWAALSLLALLAAGAATVSVVTSPTRTPAAPAPATGAPGTSTVATCGAPAGATTITLSDTEPTQTARVAIGSTLEVVVPPWSHGLPTPLRTATPGVLAERCSAVLSDHAGMIVLQAVSTGETELFATVTPASNLMMPAWLGEVVVVPR